LAPHNTAAAKVEENKRETDVKKKPRCNQQPDQPGTAKRASPPH
jgi:hypothetical protein